jgi:hypothetical protein
MKRSLALQWAKGRSWPRERRSGKLATRIKLPVFFFWQSVFTFWYHGLSCCEPQILGTPYSSVDGSIMDDTVCLILSIISSAIISLCFSKWHMLRITVHTLNLNTNISFFSPLVVRSQSKTLGLIFYYLRPVLKFTNNKLGVFMFIIIPCSFFLEAAQISKWDKHSYSKVP